MALCLHGWVDEDGCAESCDGPQEIAGYCEMHAEFHGEEMVEEITRLREERDRLRASYEPVARQLQEMQESCERELDRAIKAEDEVGRLKAGLEEARAALDWFVSEAQRAPVIVSVNPQTGFFISKETRYGNMIRVAYAPPEESIVHAINRARAGEDPETALREQFKKLDAARAEGRES